MKQTKATTGNNKLVLHFDVQTLRLAKTNSNHLQVHELCSGWTWGSLQKNNKDNPDQVTGWKAQYSNLSPQQPQAHLVSYKSYLQEHLKQSQHQYSDNILNLTKVVAPQTKVQIEKCVKNTTLPKTLSQAIREQPAQQNQLLAQYNKTGQYHILPAFYKLLLSLKKNKKDFAVVVKNDNIKDDHSEIIFQLNLFFSGEHPLFNGRNGTPLVKWDGSKGTRNFTVEETHQTVVYMLGEKQLYSTYGTLNITQEKDTEMFKQKFKNFKNVKLCVGEEEIYEVQHKLLADSAFIYEINPYHSLVLDQANYLTHQIYFTASNQPHLYTSAGGQIQEKEHYTVKVDPFDQLSDIDYFIKQVASLQEARSKQLAQIEREDRLQPEKTGEQHSASLSQQKQSNFDYIKEKLLPVLEGAFRQVDLLRPEDPIAFIALYCLKNQDRFD